MSENLNAIDNKIEVSQITDAVEAMKESMSFVFNGVEVAVKPTVSFDEMRAIIKVVTTGCFDPETNEYHPEYRDILLRSSIVTLFTNIQLPESIHDKYSLLYGTDLFTEIIGCINDELYMDIITSIDEKIHHMASANINALQSQIELVTKRFETMMDSLEDLFGGINGEDINKLTGMLAGGVFDEKKLVEAFAQQKLMSE